MRNILSQSSSEVPVVTIEHKDSSKRDIYPEIRSDYTYRVGSLFEELIRESIEDMGFDTELKDVNTEGVDIDTEDKKIGIEAWNWSSEHSYLKREESVLHNLRPYIVRILFASFINKEAKQRIESHYKEDPVIVKEIGYQVLPKKYYGFYKKYDRLEGKRFVSKRLKKELKNIIKSTVINAVRERGYKFNMEVDGPFIIATYNNEEEIKKRKEKWTVDCYIPEDGYVYSYCDLTSNDLTNTSNTSEVTSDLKNKGKTRLRPPSNDKDLLCKAGSPVPQSNETQEAIPGIYTEHVRTVTHTIPGVCTELGIVKHTIPGIPPSNENQVSLHKYFIDHTCENCHCKEYCLELLEVSEECYGNPLLMYLKYRFRYKTSFWDVMKRLKCLFSRGYMTKKYNPRSSIEIDLCNILPYDDHTDNIVPVMKYTPTLRASGFGNNFDKDIEAHDRYVEKIYRKLSEGDVNG